MTILVVSHRSDPHVARVGGVLDNLGAPWFFLATDEVGKEVSLTIDPVEDARIIGTSAELALRSVTAVWYRRVCVNPGWSEQWPDRVLSQYVHEQRVGAIRAALSQVPPNARWVNHPRANEAANVKTEQLRRAASVGLLVPQTLVSDRPLDIRAFGSRHGGTLVTKLLTPGTPLVDFETEQYTVFTNRVHLGSVSDASLAAAPAIYQPEVRKRREARAILIGDRVVTCAFESQASDATALDWRHYDFDRVRHYPLDLPSTVEDSLRDYARSFGLEFVAFDLSETENGWVFFEANPGGQWLWLEEKGGVDVAGPLADHLMSRTPHEPGLESTPL